MRVVFIVCARNSAFPVRESSPGGTTESSRELSALKAQGRLIRILKGELDARRRARGIVSGDIA